MNSNSTDAGVLVAPRSGTPPAEVSAGTRNGTAINRIGFDSCVLVAQSGAASGGPSAFTLDAKLQDSADGATGWADITGAAVQQITTANGIARVNVSLPTARRFVRVVEAVTLTGGSGPKLGAACSLVLCGPDEIPAI